MACFWKRAAAVIAVGGVLSGCGTMRSYNSELSTSSNYLGSGQVELAIQSLEQNTAGQDKDLLYYFEKGEMLRFKRDFAQSRDTWLKADEQIRIWEEDAKTDPDKVLKAMGSMVANDRVTRYDGYDYEKVLLSTRLALDHISLNDWNAARTEVKKTHEREAIIRDLNDRKYAQVEKEASQNRKVKTSYKTLKGYPVETLDDAEVTALKNSYQNAFSHYVAGFVYEALGEPSLAAAGYRQAIELRPQTPILEDGLRGLDSRVSTARRAKDTDVLFVVESGLAPVRQSKEIPLPIFTHRGMIVTQLSFPVIQPNRSVYLPAELTVDTKQRIAVTPVVNIDAMARRTLRDDMPGIILRTSVRAATRGFAQAELTNQAASRIPFGGLIAGMATSAINTAIEKADERVWRTLPGQISIARARLTPGTHTVNIPTASGWQSITVSVSGKHAVVPVRLLNSRLYVLYEGGSRAVPASVATAVPASARSVPPARATSVATPAKPVVPTVTTVAPASTIPTATVSTPAARPLPVSAPAASVPAAAPVAAKPVPTPVDARASMTPAEAELAKKREQNCAAAGQSLAARFRCEKYTSQKM